MPCEGWGRVECPLRGWAFFPVPANGLPCTGVWVCLYWQTRRPAWGGGIPYTEGLTSLHGFCGDRERFRYSDNYFIKQRICVRRPEYIHGPYPFAAFISSSFAAFSRHDSISSHVLSKSATLIITLVLRPFCVMTSGRCVRAIRRCVRTSSLRRVVCRSRCRRQDEKDSSRP